ncbi:MAG TPA: DUF3592 domain-containing protein [Steroidobacteraceae bacterium]|nr:DUF3592 domain-containing protein [Steroidobacteraceae bacterium]
MKLLELFAVMWAALNQAQVLLGAGLFAGLGTWLCGNRLYWRLWAKRVKGSVVGVRAPGKLLYYAVYRYKLPSGKWMEATSDTGALPNPDLATGRKVQLLVFKKHPDRVADAESHVLELLGSVFFAIGAACVGVALTVWPATPLTWILVSADGVFVLYLLHRSWPRRSEPPFASLSRRARPAQLLDAPVSPLEELLSGPVRAERQRLRRTLGRIVTPILMLAGLGVIALGVHLGRNTYLLQSTGERTQGTVLFLELKTNLHGSTYYPVVQFTTAEGTTVEFRDVMGSNPPAYREEEPVNVLYFRNLPEQTATIDRGMLDWLAPGVLCVMGSFLAGIALWVRLAAFG